VGNPGTVQFAGLAPGLAGLYQVNVQVPSSGLSDGDDIYVEFETDAADVNQIQIPYGSSTTASAATASRAVPASHGRARVRRFARERASQQHQP